ncbi:hypothetical protein [Phytohabitans rumicis]|uniref:hypothetical protein n=1 Tax=Phytohabitans rumicis TaxID=1076125 RepID=UPI001566C12D|nr:hypothetical protein [Phytohabitans rumicis]
MSSRKKRARRPSPEIAAARILAEATEKEALIKAAAMERAAIIGAKARRRDSWLAVAATLIAGTVPVCASDPDDTLAERTWSTIATRVKEIDIYLPDCTALPTPEAQKACTEKQQQEAAVAAVSWPFF